MKHLIKIALIDDHNLFRNGVSRILSNSNFKVVLEADNGADMIEKIKLLDKDNFPDVFIVDVNMPVMGGFDTVRWLKKNYTDCRIIILTMHSNPDYIIQFIKLGIKSYLTKDVEGDDLEKAVRLVIANDTYFPDKIAKMALLSFNSSDNTEELLNITDREMQVLKLMASDLTYSEIANELNISPRTVDTYRNNLFEKFGVRSRTGLALKAINMKLISTTNL